MENIINIINGTDIENIKSTFTSQDNFWKQFIKGVGTKTFLGDDSVRYKDNISSPAYQKSTAYLNESSTSVFNIFIREQNLEISPVLQGVWSLLLHRYSGDEDIIFGFQPPPPVLTADLEHTNNRPIPLRIKINPDTSILPWLHQIQEQWKIVQAYSQVSLNQIQELGDIPSGMSMFETLMILDDLEQVSTKISDYPITIGVKIESKLTLQVRYDRNRFQEDAITRLLGHLQTLLESIATNPQQSLGEVSLLTAFEKHQLLVEWNATKVEYPKDKCIHQLFEEQVERTPEAIAVVFEEKQLTYRELNEQANELAAYLQTLGVEPDVLVGIYVERSVEMIIGVVAIVKAGGAYVPLDPAYPQERLAHMLEDSRVSVLLTQTTLKEKLPYLNTQIVCLDSNWENLADQTRSLKSNVTPDNLAYVIYTSGSTGKPKGVAMPHAPLMNLLFWQQKQSNAGIGTKTLQFTPISFDVSFQEIFSTLGTGGILVLIDNELRRDPVGLLYFLKNNAINRLFLPFIALNQLAEAIAIEKKFPTDLKEVITAGEQLRITPAIFQWFAQAPNCTLHNHYGPSESHVVTAFALTGSPQEWAVLPPIGRPIANTQIYLLDEQMQPVPLGEAGELYIGGDALARGYLNRPDLTQELFVANPFKSGERLYKTGDLARYLSDGQIECLGRIDHQVKIRGFRIELEEIQAVLDGHTNVRTSAVVDREDLPGDKRLVAYIVPNPEQIPTPGQLRRFLQEKLPEYMIPSAFVVIEALPLSPNGKLDRQALPKPAKRQNETSEFVAPSMAMETTLAQIWCEILDIDRVGVRDNFFDLGGTSISAFQVITQVREKLKLDLKTVKLFEYPTIATLAKYLGEEESEKPTENNAQTRAQQQKAAYARRQQIIKR
ncbi:non-ribosomal peptide synthetase [Brunnivagina elsteri]|uniref:Non-ribosomal peptide synthetase n=1 Tax=Brunnivagina elsteri CCALA 953 TaxID=987040 RepID=A0A2A2TMD8_9CYAN|nr:non-ribosomal peptide synthetase [Calothrix elsteri]PAX59716.1 non-ribosomal peptide synthetase [Calothrix elsteri CCALA 953]